MKKIVLLSIILCVCFGTTLRADTTFPPAGIDIFSSALSHGLIEFIANPFGIPTMILPDDLIFTGPTTVVRSDPTVGLNGLHQIDTEIVSMNLSGNLGPINLTINESSTRDSLGQIRELTPGPDPGSFPADSFFDVFFEIEIDILPNVTIFNRDAAYVYTPTLTDLPPIGDTYYLEGWIDEGS